ncbi:carboxylesterase family protein [Actinoplanes sp. NBRC 101535]|uniref:carboxylesterase/lipase family protein n=1 Tax=Actinoplanes sp. NBRC 101535 TaxID=3032196 RepID=UPI0024A3EC85|nr:carboxylesterase family protein [Actinoplanes sp. NBRC 101535]GLY04151.1 carboxylic ester hydrolase [Actinoplanes sp. NBRC 101535]
MAAPEVRVGTGTLRGSWEGGVAVFRGIPYAAPPVGPHRFAAPQPAQPWDGVRDATAFGPPVPQAEATGAGDDCLTVNVWSPDPGPGAGLPVMVWIHGGAYVIGSACRPEYDGRLLAAEGHVVLVTLNYRLGVQGFGHVDGAPANRGLLDQVAALEWVRDAITAFGGDPGRVTVFGESAGGGSVAALLAMPRAAGLFQRAIAQSVPGTFFSAELAAAIAANPEAPAERWGAAGYRDIRIAPVIDGDVLPTSPWEATLDPGVTLLAGHTRDEQRLFTAMSGLLGEVTAEQAATALEMLAPDGGRGYREAFPGAAPEQLFEIVGSDWLFRMPTIHLADNHLKVNGTAFVYELSWPAPGLDGALGACHGLDVPLVFGNLTGTQPAMLIGDPPGDDAVALSARMRAAWTAFAAHGDPGWPAWSAGEQLTRVFDTVDVVTAYPERISYGLWRGHVFRNG